MHLPEVKVCGITRTEDAENALNLGASKLGFILYNNSPRCIKFEDILRIKNDLNLQPDKMVAVVVEPDINYLEKIKEFEFGFFQIHFSLHFPLEKIKQWSDLLGPKNLWLAPKIPLNMSFPSEILKLADTYLIDAYSDKEFGGTGKISNWDAFREWKIKYPQKKWILAGGLSPENVISSLKITNTESLDVNSGVEKSPGIKDKKKLKNFFEKIFV